MQSPVPQLRYREIAPSPALRHVVSCYWHVSVGPGYPPGEQHPIWPDGCVSVSVHLGQRRSRLVGPRMSALRVPMYPGDEVRGVRFLPDRGAAALRLSARRLRDHVGEARELLGGSVAKLIVDLPPDVDSVSATRAFETWISSRLNVGACVDEVVKVAVGLITESHGRLEAGQVAEAVGLGLRQLQRRFGDAVGLTPKQFSRIRRMRSTLARVLDTPRERWSTVAAELGYADQAHLIRDLAKLTSLTPSEIATRLADIAHVNVSP